MAVNWGLGGNGQQNALAMFQMGNQMGQQAKAAQRESETRNALATIFGEQTAGGPAGLPGTIGGFAGGTFDPATGKQVTPVQQGSAPDNSGAWQTLAQNNPELAYKLRHQQQQQQATAAEAAAKRAAERDKYIAGAAFDIVSLPENQRAAAWDAYIDQGQAQHPELAQYRGQYTPALLNSVVAKAGEMQAFKQYQQPKYTPIGEQGLAGFQYGVPIQQGGQPQNFAQAPSTGPQPGTIEDGYRFKGGNPADPNSWEQVTGGRQLSAQQYQGAVNSLGQAKADEWVARNGFTVGN